MLISIIVFVVLIAVLYIAMRNSLIGKKNQVANAEASIDVMLKKRFDLLPNLIETTKAYMKHEQSVLVELTALRQQSHPIESANKPQLDKQLSAAVSHFKVAVEAYPELKANQNIELLMRSINETEEQISAARRSFNAAVTRYNNGIEMFPSSIIAQQMQLTALPLFEIADTERANIDAARLFKQ
ncbi:LemA family protein [Photobacterium sp. Alg240-V54]|uniref:LemA family protein n=1 Tax=Photobacterium sp. Alg240-V54 TaxID=2305995 RepID=UPI001F082271|nr:LemA family protein [Photobacterium sp. Alg240-V54]